MAIDIVSFTIENGDSPYSYVCLPNGKLLFSHGFPIVTAAGKAEFTATLPNSNVHLGDEGKQRKTIWDTSPSSLCVCQSPVGYGSKPCTPGEHPKNDYSLYWDVHLPNFDGNWY